MLRQPLIVYGELHQPRGSVTKLSWWVHLALIVSVIIVVIVWLPSSPLWLNDILVTSLRWLLELAEIQPLCISNDVLRLLCPISELHLRRVLGAMIWLTEVTLRYFKIARAFHLELFHAVFEGFDVQVWWLLWVIRFEADGVWILRDLCLFQIY